MSTHCGCEGAPAGRGLGAWGAWGGRAAEVTKWAIPGAAWALMPKCPACVAASVALGTGVGLSVTGAACLRTAALVASAVSLGYLAVTRGRRWLARRHAAAEPKRA